MNRSEKAAQHARPAAPLRTAFPISAAGFYAMAWRAKIARGDVNRSALLHIERARGHGEFIARSDGATQAAHAGRKGCEKGMRKRLGFSTTRK
ncbi:hypothetical protein [Herbaspirillum sp.]|uniref:hypothetical protein n=1 Tax=Herbaspirillum sp. TaxID=1890675 RepID=UPI0031D87A16